MIGIGKKDRSAKLFQRFLRQSLDSSRRTHRQERRRLNHSVRRAQLTPPPGRRRIRFLYFKRKTHVMSVSGENPRTAYAAYDINCPHAERDGKRLAALELLRIRRGETDSQQEQRPKRENIK